MAIQIARNVYPELPFRASKSWADLFTRKNRLVTRKITHLVFRHEIASFEELNKATDLFRNEMKTLLHVYSPSAIFNTDQCGFNYEVTFQRTLSEKGEKTTVGYA